MERTTLIVIAVALGALLFSIVLLALFVRRTARERAVLQALLAGNQQETALLRARLDELADELVQRQGNLAVNSSAEFLITDVGQAKEARLDRLRVSDQVVLSATLGEPLVRVAAFSHGIRRALSAESRNRIWFEIRREVRRARKERRRAMKEAWRAVQAQQRAQASAQDAA